MHVSWMLRPVLALQHDRNRQDGERLNRHPKGRNMKRTLLTLALGASLLAAVAAPARAADVSLARIDCGTPQAPTAVNERFSDTYAYGDLKLQFVFSCYVIKHGDDYMLWDTGHSMTMPKLAPAVSLVD